jgi:uncharacterized protein YeaO (DUF488 family)
MPSAADRRLAVRLRRAYDPPAPADGGRVLVDRLWPRGVSREQLRVDAWLRDLGPSDALRRWFGHDPARWEEFRRRYRRELAAKRALLDELAGYARGGTLTLVYGARDPEHNQAVVIKELLEGGRRASPRRGAEGRGAGARPGTRRRHGAGSPRER